LLFESIIVYAKQKHKYLDICANVASILWHLEYARYKNNTKYSSSNFLNRMQHAANRIIWLLKNIIYIS